MQDGFQSLWCADPDAAAEWYAGVLGCPIERPRPRVARIRFDPIDLAFLPAEQNPSPPDDGAVWAWFTVDDLVGARGLFVQAGATADGPLLELGAMSMQKLRDPFGGLIALIGPPPAGPEAGGSEAG